MNDDYAKLAWERLVLNSEMLCERTFSTILCKSCDYYYIYQSNGCNVASCLKNDIKNWTLYRMSER